MGLWYSIIADIINTMLFFYLPAIYWLVPRKGNRYSAYIVFNILYLIWEIPTRFYQDISHALPLIIMNFTVLLIIILILYKDNWKRKVMCWIFIVLMGIVTDIITTLLFMTINKNIFTDYLYSEFNESFTNMLHLMSLLVYEVMNTAIALIYIIYVRIRKMSSYMGFFLLPIYQVFIIIGFFMLCDDFNSRAALLGLAMGIFNLILDGTVLYLLESIFTKIQKEKELKRIQEQRNVEYEYYLSEAEVVEQMRMIRHDFANQLQTVYNMMDDSANTDDIKHMIGAMKENLDENVWEENHEQDKK